MGSKGGPLINRPRIRFNLPGETHMLGIGDKLPEFEVVGVKPKFNQHEENGESAFEPITNEFFKLGWRREHQDLNGLNQWQFADTTGSLVDGLGVRSPEGVAYRYTYIVDPDGVIQHVYATNLNVGRNPEDTLRVLDALQTDELCPCNRTVGG